MKIAVDMDGVMADMPNGFIRGCKILKPWVERKLEDITDYNIDHAFKDPGIMQKIFMLPNFFRELDVMPGTIEYLSALKSEGHEILILTMLPNQHGNILTNKLEWLEEHIFPKTKLQAKDVVFCFGKQWFDGDIMIDDYPKHLLSFSGTRVLVDWPYNRSVEEYGHDTINRFIRVQKETAWKEFYNLVTQQKRIKYFLIDISIFPFF